MTDSTRQQTAAISRSLAELADGSYAARLRLEQAARVITTARRASALAATGALRQPNPADGAAQAVSEIARHWDAAAVTALEYAETLPEAAIERLLRAAPAWAAAFRAGSQTRLAA